MIQGELTLVVEGEELRLGVHEIARVAPDVRRQLVNRSAEPLRLLAIGASGEHAGRDGVAWSSWDEPAEAGRPPQDVPLPANVPTAP